MKKTSKLPIIIDTYLICNIFMPCINKIKADINLKIYNVYKKFTADKNTNKDNIKNKKYFVEEDQNSKDYSKQFTISISFLVNSIKYIFITELIEYSEYYGQDNKLFKQFFLYKKDYYSKYIFKKFKNLIIENANELLNISYYKDIKYSKTLYKNQKILSFLKLFENNITYECDYDNFKYDIIFHLDNSKIVKEVINITKIKTALNEVKNSEDFISYFKDSFIKTNKTFIKEKIYKDFNINIYMTLKLKTNIYINIARFILESDEKLYNAKINENVFSDTINKFLNKCKLYNMLNNPLDPETKVITSIQEKTPDNILCTYKCFKEFVVYRNKKSYFKDIFIHL